VSWRRATPGLTRGRGDSKMCWGRTILIVGRELVATTKEAPLGML